MAKATVRQGNVRRLIGRGRTRRMRAGRRARRRALRSRRITSRAVKAIVNRQLNRRNENKCFYIAQQTVYPAGGWTAIQLTNVLPGEPTPASLPTQRDGNTIYAKSLKVNILCILNQLQTHDYVRWAIVDFPDGHDGQVADVITNTATASGSLIGFFRRRDDARVVGQKRPYKVLASGHEFLNQTTKQQDLNRINIKLNTKFEWDEEDTTGQNHLKHRIKLFVFTAQAANDTAIHYVSRLYFQDP